MKTNLRFFYHYFKSKKCMSVHFQNKCSIVNEIKCNVPCETHWRKTQPQLIMRGFCKAIKIENNTAYIT